MFEVGQSVFSSTNGNQVVLEINEGFVNCAASAESTNIFVYSSDEKFHSDDLHPTIFPSLTDMITYFNNL